MNGWERVKCRTRMIVAASLIISVAECYESLRLRKKDSFIHPGSAKKFSSCNGFIEHHVNYFTDSCDKCDKTPDGLRRE